MSGYGLPPELAERLIAMGRDACNFFEHACIELEPIPHNPNGCYLCEGGDGP